MKRTSRSASVCVAIIIINYIKPTILAVRVDFLDRRTNIPPLAPVQELVGQPLGVISGRQTDMDRVEREEVTKTRKK